MEQGEEEEEGMLSPLNDGAKLYCEYSEILGVPDNLVRWRMRYSSIRMFYYSYLKNDGSLDVLYQFLSMYCSDPSKILLSDMRCRVIFISNYPNILYISHRANILLNILDVQMLRSFLYHEVHFYKERWISKNLLRLYSKIRLFLFKLYITKILV